MLTVNIPKSKEKITNQIKSLEYQLSKDTNEKDRLIHQAAIDKLKRNL